MVSLVGSSQFSIQKRLGVLQATPLGHGGPLSQKPGAACGGYGGWSHLLQQLPEVGAARDMENRRHDSGAEPSWNSS